MSKVPTSLKMEDGKIVLCPLVECSTFTAYEMGIGLQLVFVRSEEDLRNGNYENEAFVMSPNQAEQVAQMLVHAANKAREASTSSKVN